MRQQIVLLAFVAVSMGSAFGQVGAPTMGWVPDGAHVRPVYGIPAAAAVGAPIPLDQDFSQIAVSPTRNYVLVSAADSGTVSLYTAERGLIPIDGARSAPDLIVVSPRGSAAALWFSSLGQLQVITGLPDAPKIRQLDASFLGSGLVSTSGALAISDDGGWLAGAWPQGVYAFGPSGEVNRLPLETVAALAFFQGTHDLAAAGTASVQVLKGISGFAVASTLLTSEDSSLNPVAVATTSDNRTLVFADRGGSVTAIDIGSATSTASDCGCHPEGLFGMGPSAFRLTGLDGGAFKLFDASLGEILFVPIAQPAVTEGAAQ